MTLPAATKIGVGSTLAIGTPTSLYFTWDHINYYEAERKVIYDTTDLSEADITATAPTGETNIKKFHSSDNKWSCSIRAKLVTGESGNIDETNKTALASYIKGKINSSDPNTKQSNRKTLVHACSRKRTIDNDAVNAELTISVSKDSNGKLFVSLFVKDEEVNNTSGG